MSKINIKTKFKKSRYSGRPSIGDLNPGETFRFQNGSTDKIYMKIDDERQVNEHYENVFAQNWNNSSYYASFSGQVYAARGNEEITLVRVTAVAEPE